MTKNNHEYAGRGAMMALFTVAVMMTGCAADSLPSPETEAQSEALLSAQAGSSGSGERLCGSRGLPRCRPGEFCDFPETASCGETDKPGVCTPRPRVCTHIYKPVCGCDGNTYSNDCAAAAAGVSVRSQGRCDEGRACGGLLGLRCEPNEYCNFPPEAMCGFADATGICTTIPFACTKEYRPVCGCDGKTYGNPCMAAAAGISVASQGECEGNGEVCGGLLGIPCRADQYCDFAAGDGCDVADGQGICADRPEACTLQYDPVCGCDNQTYGNACIAALNGVSVRSQGACK